MNYYFIYVPISEGWPAIFRVAISLLKTVESSMLETDLEGVGCCCMRELPMCDMRAILIVDTKVDFAIIAAA